MRHVYNARESRTMAWTRCHPDAKPGLLQIYKNRYKA